jgi:NADH-quinone oxidoreductase subunit F
MATSTLISPCCSRCSHSPGEPCADLVACIENGPLCHDDGACRSERRSRLQRIRRGGDGTILFVGAGTCGRANGALRVIEQIQAYVWDHSLPVTLVEVGCVGYCQREVFVDLRMNGDIRLSYCDLSPENTQEFLDAVFARDELCTRFLYGRYGEAPGFEDVPLVMETLHNTEPTSRTPRDAEGEDG